MNEFDKRLRSPDLWFKAAVAAAALTFFAVIIAILSILFGSSEANMATRADIVYKFALIGAGFITFLTVGWRGILATKQVEAQREQLDGLSKQIAATERQIAATEENNLAKLLQDGAKLIAEIEKTAHVEAGIATLVAVSLAPGPMFARQALNLLADFVQDHYRKPGSRKHVLAAISGLRDANFIEGRSSDRWLELSFEPNGMPVEHEIVLGVAHVTYVGGQITAMTLDEAGPKYAFKNVSLDIGTVYLDGSRGASAEKCRFYRCRIRTAARHTLASSEFSHCDFSGCRFLLKQNQPFPDMRNGKNWYDPERPPSANIELDFEWNERLLDHSSGRAKVAHPDAADHAAFSLRPKAEAATAARRSSGASPEDQPLLGGDEVRDAE